MDNKSSHYLRFIFDRQLFEFTCLPFGLNVAPFVFTKLMKPVMSFLRKQGHRSVIYLDDILGFGDSMDNCLSNIKATINLLGNLGFRINKKKSQIQPNMVREYLGMIYNSRDMTVELPESKIHKVLRAISLFENLKTCSIRKWASFVGLIGSCCPAVRYGRLYTKVFEQLRYSNLVSNNNNFDALMELPDGLEPIFEWWRQNVTAARNPIRNLNYTRVIFIDASNTGWGAFCNGQKTHGFWSETELKFHINRLEILAILFGLKSFASDYRSCEILLRVDNTTAIAYVNKMGGVQYPHLHAIAQEIWQWCEARDIWVQASYIRSTDNVEANEESRVKNIDGEWSLAQNIFSNVTKMFGTPSIDLFASRLNKKCERYYSWRKDPEALAVDAFTRDWGSEPCFWAFPPFALILKTLKKIKTDEATGLMVVANWPNQAWYPVFHSLLINKPIHLQPSDSLLQSPFRSIRHPLRKSLALIVGRLSGRPSVLEVSPSQQ